MQVAFIAGSLSWFEPVPARVQANTPSAALVDLQVFDDGPAGPARNMSGLLAVTIPTPPGLDRCAGSRETVLRCTPIAKRI